MVVLTENSSQRDELDKGIPSHGGSGGMGQRLGRGQWQHEAGPATTGGSGGMGRGPVVGPGAGGHSCGWWQGAMAEGAAGKR